MAAPVIRRGTHPIGIVLVHDITGRDAANEAMAERLNKQGFWVASVDVFKGKTAPNLEEGMKLRATMTKADMERELGDGLEALKKAMGKGRIGSMGYCMGGGVALQASCVLPFAFCVDYYGRMEVADLKGFSAPLLLVLGGEDAPFNPWAFNELIPALAKEKKRAQIEIYPGVGHAFHRKGWPPYNEAAAEDAFARTTEFIRRVAA